jgi:hypothetical protein
MSKTFGYVSNKGSHFRWWEPRAALPTGSERTSAHDAVGGLHGHTNRGVAPDLAGAATDRSVDELRAATRGQSRGA